MRVVSLLPSATEMVHFAGAGRFPRRRHPRVRPPARRREAAELTSSRIDPALMTSAEIDAAR